MAVLEAHFHNYFRLHQQIRDYQEILQSCFPHNGCATTKAGEGQSQRQSDCTSGVPTCAIDDFQPDSIADDRELTSREQIQGELYRSREYLQQELRSLAQIIKFLMEMELNSLGINIPGGVSVCIHPSSAKNHVYFLQISVGATGRQRYIDQKLVQGIGAIVQDVVKGPFILGQPRTQTATSLLTVRYMMSVSDI